MGWAGLGGCSERGLEPGLGAAGTGEFLFGDRNGLAIARSVVRGEGPRGIGAPTG